MMKKAKKYIFLSWMGISFGLAFSALFTGAGFILDARGAWQGGKPDLLGFIIGIVSLVLTLGINAFNNWKSIASAYGKTDKGKGLMNEAISACLDAADRYDVDNKESRLRKDKYKSYLQEIVEADKIYPIELEFDSKQSSDDLFSVNSTMSITEAPILAWKNPEYQWFLLNHYASTLLRRLKGNKIEIYNRYQYTGSTAFTTAFSEFSNHAKEVLNAVAEFGYSNGDSVRFYLVDRDKISEFKDMLKQFVAGHELFGVYLFFIDSCILVPDSGKAEINLKDAVNQIKKSLYHNPKEVNIDISKDVLDLMVVEQSDNLIYKYSKDGNLKDLDNNTTKDNISELLKGIAKKLNKNPQKWLLYPSGPEHTYSDDSCMGNNAINKIYSIMDKTNGTSQNPSSTI